MKKILAIFIITLLIFSCDRNDDYYYYENTTGYKASLMDKNELKNSVSFKEKRGLINPGKIYFKDNYIFINEKYKGIHIIDNQDSLNPVNIGFIRVPGCIDMAIKSNTLYVDNATDLVAVDLSDMQNIKPVSRITDVFQEPFPPNGENIPWEFRPENRPENTVIVEWIKL